jgi:hypothetical protein
LPNALQNSPRSAVYVIDTNIILCEVDRGIQRDQDDFDPVGLPDGTREPDRIRAALKNCGCDIRPRTSPSTPPPPSDGSLFALVELRAAFRRIGRIGSP